MNSGKENQLAESIVHGHESVDSRSLSDDGDNPPISSNASHNRMPDRARIKWIGATSTHILAVFLVMVPTMLVHHFTRKYEVETFKRAFRELEAKVHSSLQIKFSRAIGGVESLSVAATSYVLNSEDDWPFVSLPDFNLHAANIVEQSGLLLVGLNPLVSEEHRDAWTNFSLANLDWVDGPSEPYEPFEDQRGQKSNDGIFPFIYKIQQNDDGSFAFLPDTTSEAPCLPSWTQYPLFLRRSLNYNLRSSPIDLPGLNAVNSAGDPSFVFTSLSFIPSTVDVFYTELLKLAFQDPNAKYQQEPISNLYFPVFDSFDSENRKVVALTLGNIYWPLMFRDVLPESPNNELLCVVRNTCGDVFTMRIDGKESIFEGFKDTSDPNLRGVSRAFTLADLAEASEENSGVLNVSMKQDFCPYTFHVYPTPTMRNGHMSYLPAIYATATGFFFALVAIAVTSYGCITRRRSKAIVKAALTNGKLADSIFPENLRRRLHQMKLQSGRAMVKHTEITARPGDFLSILEKPVADHFPDCTIFFSCIDGFGEWSLDRSSLDIFELLEGFFLALDKLALRHSIFKIETIGDTFVAATGIPDSQAQHYILMANFARDVMRMSHKVKMRLSAALGPLDNLNLRAGIHSGACLGGVLGGDKSRFQVFGDTINFASRMMSTGAAGKVQLSDETAQLLIGEGDNNWTDLRSDKVVVKGKPLPISTHWLRLRSSLKRS